MARETGILSLGIDTGGTFTDAVLYEPGNRHIYAAAKAFTTYQDLSIGILEAVRKVLALYRENSQNSEKPESPEKPERPTRPSSTVDSSTRERQTLPPISFVGLSTTLATNALVEGRGGRVGLILIGYDLELLETFRLKEELGTRDFINIPAGHNEDGTEQAPLNEEEARAGILQFLGKVDAFAVSGYFGVRNPDHELRVKALIQDLSSRLGIQVPVTCGHELTSRLDSVRRAMTTVMNARLIPLLQKLIQTVRSSLDSLGIRAPLMVVRGDGSLMRAEWALDRPIETILSGPAASVVGAQTLTGKTTFWMVDVGGTTTDFAFISDGLPRLNREGARVGKWKTMVEAIDLRTIGLGGDSRVQLPGIGPERVVPLSVLAHRYPAVLEELRRQAQGSPRSDLAGRFLLLRLHPAEIWNRQDLSDRERLLVNLLQEGPLSLESLSSHERLGYTLEQNVRHLISSGVAMEGGFTPTDALHVLGELSLGNQEAALLGAQIQARLVGISPEILCRKVQEQVSFLIARELALCSLEMSVNAIRPISRNGIETGGLAGGAHVRGTSVLENACALGTILLEAALTLQETGSAMESSPPFSTTNLVQETFRELETSTGLEPFSGNDGNRPALFQVSFTLKDPVVAIGAPVKTYLPDTAHRLHTSLLIPDHAEVANAVGAVAGLVVERVRVEIQQIQQGKEILYRAHTPHGLVDHTDLTECIRSITLSLEECVREEALLAGADQVEVHVERKDHFGSSQGNTNDIYLNTELEFIAIGRPGYSEHSDVCDT